MARRLDPASSWRPSPTGWSRSADTQIALPEIGLGLVPGAGGTVSLPLRIGRAADGLARTCPGDAIDAETALAWGLVDVVSA